VPVIPTAVVENVLPPICKNDPDGVTTLKLPEHPTEPCMVRVVPSVPYTLTGRGSLSDTLVVDASSPYDTLKI
jgi:hypothetical protein